MATYKIAPDSTGEIGMAQMKYGLVNSADYDNSNGVTTEINMQTLVVNSTTYQSDLTSKTWDTSQPYGFGEMYGQTWNDGLTILFNQSVNTDCSKYQGTVRVNGTTEVTFSKNSGSPASPNSDSIQVSPGDTILISVTAQTPTGQGCAGLGSEVTIRTGPNAGSLTTRKTINSLNTDTYSYTASTSEAYISIISVATP